MRTKFLTLHSSLISETVFTAHKYIGDCYATVHSTQKTVQENFAMNYELWTELVNTSSLNFNFCLCRLFFQNIAHIERNFFYRFIKARIFVPIFIFVKFSFGTPALKKLINTFWKTLSEEIVAFSSRQKIEVNFVVALRHRNFVFHNFFPSEKFSTKTFSE